MVLLITTTLLLMLHIPTMAFMLRSGTFHPIIQSASHNSLLSLLPGATTTSNRLLEQRRYRNPSYSTIPCRCSSMRRAGDGKEEADNDDEDTTSNFHSSRTNDEVTSGDDGHHSKEFTTKSRRSFGTTLFTTATTVAMTIGVNVKPSYAGEVGTAMNKAVTKSDLGVSVRRSVVKGAQVIDSLDGKWEKFSDENNLGKERSKREARPKPQDIPDPLPLDSPIARAVLKASDETFLSMVPPGTDLKGQITKVDGLVRTTFEKGGGEGFTLVASSIEDGDIGGGSMDAKQFNYDCYVHYKAFCMILVENKLPFDRKKFESELGERLLPIFLPQKGALPTTPNTNNPKQKKEEILSIAIQNALSLTDNLCTVLKSSGFVSLAERSELETEDIVDWTRDLSDLQFNVPLDRDVTLNAQILLQEQGYRIYPDFGRFVIAAALQRSLIGLKQVVTSEEYYMDTNWNSDPSLFEVRQVLVSIIIDSV